MINISISNSLEGLRNFLQHIGLHAAWTQIEYLPANKDASNALLSALLNDDAPCMIARMGYFELGVVANYLSIRKGDGSIMPYLLGKSCSWWWDRKLCTQFHNNAGFFPVSEENLVRFSNLMLADMSQVDVLGSWLKYEQQIHQLQSAARIGLHDLEPFFAARPWTHALAGKKVLLVHPFEQSIVCQNAKLADIFPNGMMPPFTLKTIKAVQTIAGEPSQFCDWFAALDYMKAEIDAIDYDICIIGAGAYGLPLAAHVKRMGKKSFHLGGATQLLFGIKGRRWDESDIWPYRQLYNEHWVRPASAELPKHAAKVEGACYW